jgi:hypothetical protein
MYNQILLGLRLKRGVLLGPLILLGPKFRILLEIRLLAGMGP